jgi:ArsR family metal-binding transcriptional regulator
MRRGCIWQKIFSGVLPYLNATLRGAVHLPAANALTWKKGGHNIAFHAHEIATSNVEDRAGDEKEIKGLVDLVNRTWQRRAEITPDTRTRQWPTPMALIKLLPQTNCKQVGSPHCFIFAHKVAAAQSNWPHVRPWSSRSTQSSWLRWKLC